MLHHTCRQLVLHQGDAPHNQLHQILQGRRGVDRESEGKKRMGYSGDAGLIEREGKRGGVTLLASSDIAGETRGRYNSM